MAGTPSDSGVSSVSEQQVDDKYNDPSADITLVSADGVLFYLGSFYLKAKSIVFRNMMTTAQPTRREPLAVEASTRALRLFLDFIIGTEVIKIDNLSVLKDAMELSDKFDCHLVKHAILLHLHSNLALSPWTAFCIAAACSNTPLAKAAIRQMAVKSIPRQMHAGTSKG